MVAKGQTMTYEQAGTKDELRERAYRLRMGRQHGMVRPTSQKEEEPHTD
jgi:hypothetical protein